MSETKKNDNPFDAFDILKGNFVLPSNDESEDEEQEENTDSDDSEQEEQEFSQEAEDALKKVIEQQSKSKTPNSTEEADESEEEESDDNTTDEQTNGYIDAIKDLHEKGILDFESDDIEDSEEGLEKAIQETINNKIKKHVASLGDEALDFLAFVENGGNPKDFVTTYYGNQSWSEFNIESEAAQKVAIRESLKLAGETAEDIEDLIAEFEDNGTLEKRAKSALLKLSKKEEEQKAQLVEAQKQRAEAEKAANKKYWDEFKSNLDKKEDIKGFKLTPKLKENLWKHMTLVDRSTGKTAYQMAIENDTDAQLLFALQSMTKFDISKLEKQVENKVTSKVSGLIKNYRPSSKEKISSGRTHVEKDGDDPFALFGKIK